MIDERLRSIEARLQENADKIDLVRTVDIPALRVDIAGLKVNARLWGALAGFLASLVVAGLTAWALR